MTPRGEAPRDLRSEWEAGIPVSMRLVKDAAALNDAGIKVERRAKPVAPKAVKTNWKYMK